jgi:hypothetical protein
LTTSIAGYETEVGLFGYRELITRGAIDIARLVGRVHRMP